jgi:hypothetical protein
MTTTLRHARSGAAVILLLTACSSGAGSGIGDILSGVLGGGGAAQAAQAAGTVRGVDTRNQQISLQLTNGQTVALGFDNNTKVVYQNQLYAVTNLESGDQVVARVKDAGNGAYYTDSVSVTQSVQNTSGTGSASSSGNVQSLQGTVRQIDRTNGLFTLEAGNGVMLTVSLPYNTSTTDRNKFNNLRSGDGVRMYGVFLNNTRVELRQFY